MLLPQPTRIFAPVFLALMLAPALTATQGTAVRAQGKQDKVAKKPAEDKPANKPEEKPEPSVFVSGNVPILLDKPQSPFSLLLSWIGSQYTGDEMPDRYMWACFSLRPKPTDKQGQAGTNAAVPRIKVVISATGLGPAHFARKDEGGCKTGCLEGSGPKRSCEVFVGEGGGWTKEFSHWESVLELSSQQPEEVIGVRVPTGVVKQAGGSVEGKIIIQEVGWKPLEVPLKIEKPSDPFSTGLQWFGAIAVPALISFGLGYGASKLNTSLSSRTEQQRAFAKYKDDEYATLNSFFKDFYAAQCHAYPNDWPRIAEDLLNEMRSKKILRDVPQRERKRLEAAMARGDKEEIKKSLLALFKEWEKIIKNPDHDRDSGGN